MIALDTETYNEKVDIKVGTYRYAKTCELMLVPYSLDGTNVQLWDKTRDLIMPQDLRHALFHTDEPILAHHSNFDRLVLHFTEGLPLDPTRWRCSMTKAMCHSLPGALEKLGWILGVNERAESKGDGRKLMLKFCKPWPTHKVGRHTAWTDPEDWARFCQYAIDDVRDMIAIWNKLPDWNYRGSELALWFLDQRINDRGIAVDLELCRQAVRASEAAKRELKRQVTEETDGAVTAATQRDKLLAYILEEYGVALPNMTASTLERRLADPELPDPVRQLIQVRLEATKTSTSKYSAFLKATDDDGRLRGMLAFSGALRTSRWSGRIVQLQNLMRPTMDKDMIAAGIQAILNGVEDLIFPNVMTLCANAVRGALVAPKGRKLIVGDLSNIEGRKLAWLAREAWKIQAFMDYDAKIGPDLYKVTAGRSFGLTVEEIDEFLRQLGKVQELALGYRGAEGAFVSMAAVYKLDVDALFEPVCAALPDLLEEAEGFYEWACERNFPTTRALSREAFLAACMLKISWRRENPMIVQYWDDIEQMVRLAIENPGQAFKVRNIAAKFGKSWLRIRLPSGRYLCYPQTRVDADGSISYMGINQYTRQWQRLRTYSGKIVENIVQAAARDVLAANMPAAEEAGYNIVLTVHDELVTETPDSDDFTPEGLAEIMTRVPEWAEGLPLAAKATQMYRYRKD